MKKSLKNADHHHLEFEPTKAEKNNSNNANKMNYQVRLDQSFKLTIIVIK